MPTVLSWQVVPAPQPQSGASGGHAQSVTAPGSVQTRHSIPEAHWASIVQCAGVHPSSCVGAHGSGVGHEAPGAHGAADAQPDAATTVHSNPTAHVGPSPQPGVPIALANELSSVTAEAANVARTKRSWFMGDSP